MEKGWSKRDVMYKQGQGMTSKKCEARECKGQKVW